MNKLVTINKKFAVFKKKKYFYGSSQKFWFFISIHHSQQCLDPKMFFKDVIIYQ